MRSDPDSLGELSRLQGLASQLERQRRFLEARDAVEAALLLDPSSQLLIEQRARLAILLAEPDAPDHCARALAFRKEDPELQYQMIATAAVELGEAAIPLVESYLDDHPDDIEAHELIADLRAQSGQDDFLDSYQRALHRIDDPLPLLMSYWRMLGHSSHPSQVMESMDQYRSQLGDRREFLMLEVAIASKLRMSDRVTRILDDLDDQADAQIARAWFELGRHRPEAAATYLESAVRRQPDNLEAWGLLELTWRMTEDSRHRWLIGQEPYYRSFELNLDQRQLDDIADVLRRLHRARSQPIGQSVRGGTQTFGNLFLRSDPELQVFMEAVAPAIRHFVLSLPAKDPAHPLLRLRDSKMAFGPSWSVRFTGSGHHAPHIHPGGILSSACYIIAPSPAASTERQEGWLEIGRPPDDLGLDLPPLAAIEPKPGRLVLFPSYLFHGTRPFCGGERLSVAFDLMAVA